MARESTQELILEEALIWEAPISIPGPANLNGARRGRPPSPPPLPRPQPGRVLGRLERLRKLLDFAQWQRVAMVRFGISQAIEQQPAAISIVDLIKQLHAASEGPGDPERQRRIYDVVLVMLAKNQSALDDAVEAIGRALGIGDCTP